MATTFRAIYSRNSDLVSSDATVTVETGTAVTQYGPERLIDTLPTRAAKLAELQGAFKFAFSTPTRVDWIAIPAGHNLDAGLPCRLLGSDTSNWASPTLALDLVVPAWRTDRLSVGFFGDVTAAAGYLVGGFSNYLLTVDDDNTAAITIGEVGLIAPMRTLNPNFDWGLTPTRQRAGVRRRTPTGVRWGYDRGTTLRRLVATCEATDALREEILTWWEDCRGDMRPFFLVVDGTEAEALMVRWTEAALENPWMFLDRNPIRLEFEVLTPGITD